MNKAFQLLVFVGRFQPVHNGHLDVIKAALDQAEQVLILVGSANISPTKHNPFTFDERKRMIELACGIDGFVEKPRVTIKPLDDLHDDDEWVVQVQEAAWQTVNFMPDAKIGLIGRSKDDSSYYLRLFPQWEGINVVNEATKGIDATGIRNVLFISDVPDKTELANFLCNGEGPMSPAVGQYLLNWWEGPSFANIKAEEAYIYEKYTKPWEGSPYTPTFITADNVLIQSGHVLLVTRKDYPGKGLLALPGGFIKPSERLLNCALRELKEETKIDLPPQVLRSSVKGQRTFDHPHRDPRGRFITTAFLFDLPKGRTLPKVKGADDAIHAAWYDVARLQPSDMFIDHYSIMKSMMRML